MSRPQRLRVLVVDDSAIARRFITGRLERDHDLEVVGAAASGPAALELVATAQPDAVVLDEEMPGMSGRDVLRRLRQDHPEVAVVMFSARVGQGAMARFEALYLGADDAVAKPRSAGGPVTDTHPTWTELLVKIKRAASRPERGGVHRDVARGAAADPSAGAEPQAAGPLVTTPPGVSPGDEVPPAPGRPVAPPDPRTPGRRAPGGTDVAAGRRSGVGPAVAPAPAMPRWPSAAPARRVADRPAATGGPVPGRTGRRASRPAWHEPPTSVVVPRAVSRGGPGCVVVASSTGGPDALGVLFGALGADFPLPVLVVQHMPPVFTALLADRLDGRSALTVREAGAGEPVRAGEVLVSPGDHHLAVTADRGAPLTVLGVGPPENSCRPAADVLLRSAVQVYGGRVLAVVLSGMGQDGMLGSEQVRAAGGHVIAQDEASSVVWGMPGAVVAAGHADAVLPIDAIAAELTAHARSLASSTPAGTAGRGGAR